jgi:hypothetical protein
VAVVVQEVIELQRVMQSAPVSHTQSQWVQEAQDLQHKGHRAQSVYLILLHQQVVVVGVVAAVARKMVQAAHQVVVPRVVVPLPAGQQAQLGKDLQVVVAQEHLRHILVVAVVVPGVSEQVALAVQLDRVLQD